MVTEPSFSSSDALEGFSHLRTDNQPIKVIAFYHFARLDDYEDMKMPLLDFCNQRHLKGTILLAKEGVNSTISGSPEDIEALISHLNEDPRLAGFIYKESFHENKPFEKMKVRLKKEIVAMGVEDLDIVHRGDYIDPQEWDEFIARDDVVVIDTRNEYETRIGTFEGAIDPDTKTFRQFPKWAQDWAQDKAKGDLKVAMFCTGGIRCEKSTAYMKSIGFENVYHLDGGILNYFEKTGNQNGAWKGDCFVFDDRTALNATLEATDAVRCTKCGDPVTADNLKHGPKAVIWCASCQEEEGLPSVGYE